MGVDAIELVSTHLGLDLRNHRRLDAQIDWVRKGGPGQSAFVDLAQAYREYVNSQPIVPPLDGAVFRPYVSSQLQDGLFDASLDLSEYGHDRRSWTLTSDVMRYLLLYCDGVVVDNPLARFVDKAAMFDQPSMAATARDRLASFLRFVGEYVPLIDAGAIALIEPVSAIHNEPLHLYGAGEATAEAYRRIGAAASAATPEESASVVEGYVAGQLASWSHHESRFNIHLPSELALRMVVDVAAEHGATARDQSTLRRVAKIRLPSVDHIEPSLLLGLRASDQMNELRQALRSTLLALGHAPNEVGGDDIQLELAHRIGNAVAAHGHRGLNPTTRAVGFASLGTILGGILGGPLGAVLGKGAGTAIGAGLGAGAGVLGEKTLDRRRSRRDPLARLAVVLRTTPERPAAPRQ